MTTFFQFSTLTLCIFCFVVKERPELESRFEERVQEVVKYASTIDNFGKLVDPQTLARHCLGPEPSQYIIRAIHWEEQKSRLC